MKRQAWAFAALMVMLGAPAWAQEAVDRKADRLVQRTYPVGDLVLTPKQRAAPTPKPANVMVIAPELAPNYRPLVDLLT
ncbi:MAG: hypothetical protein U0800_14780 [Isosphaeraceae bacterium]